MDEAEKRLKALEALCKQRASHVAELIAAADKFAELVAKNAEFEQKARLGLIGKPYWRDADSAPLNGGSLMNAIRERMRDAGLSWCAPQRIGGTSPAAEKVAAEQVDGFLFYQRNLVDEIKAAAPSDSQEQAA